MNEKLNNSITIQYDDEDSSTTTDKVVSGIPGIEVDSKFYFNIDSSIPGDNFLYDVIPHIDEETYRRQVWGAWETFNSIRPFDDNDHLQVRLIAHTPNAEKVAFSAIRSCYSPGNSVDLYNKEYDRYKNKKGGDDAIRLIKEIVGHGHTSTLEHITFTCSVINMSRACLAQLTRHRVGWSYSVQSQRYVKQSTDSKHGGYIFAEPQVDYLDAGNRDKAGQIYGAAVAYLQEAYDSLIGLGVKAEDARAILPMNSCCNLTVSFNLRALLDFYGKRRPGTHAQGEIQELAELFREVVVEAEPWIDGLFEMLYPTKVEN